MKLLTNSDEIWVEKATEKDLREGARYAALTLPWTFNRMMKNTGSNGQKERALNIAKGIVGQEILHRLLKKHGIQSEIERKSHRDDDLFDFKILVNGDYLNLDVKTLNYFNNYNIKERLPFSKDFLIKNSAYPGPDWRIFFPMMVPHTQINQQKEAYCFAIADSIDFRKDISTDRMGYELTAFPYGEPLPFLSSSKLCIERESANQGFYVECTYKADSLFSPNKIQFSIIGEWAGKNCKTTYNIENNSKEVAGPFSCIASFQIEKNDFDDFSGHIEIRVSQNDLKKVVRNSAKQNINLIPEPSLILTKNDFCNLLLPSDYKVYYLGWIKKEEFLQKCKKYTGWIWPNDRINKFENQPWTQITEKDKSAVDKAGFSNCIQSNPRLLKAGWLKTSGGRGGNACCYVFPNIQRGGIKETNLYVLPKDLHIMQELRSVEANF